MKQYNITADVYASWGDVAPRYRVYVDHDLLTERDFVWPGHETFIREQILVDLAPGTHTLKIEHIGNNGKITVKNITVNGQASAPDFIIQ
jgi:hypothetical protein